MGTIYKNAYILDPAQDIEGPGEIFVDGGRIVGILNDEAARGKIVPMLVPSYDTEIIDLGGAFLTPGWVDLNTHVFDTLGDFCLPADDMGIRSGVTTAVDAGTSGTLTFNTFRRNVVEASKTRVYAFLDPSLLYIATSDAIAHRLDIAAHPRNQDIDRAAAVVDENRDIIVGFNVRPVRRPGESRSPVLDAARTLADRFSLPLLVQLGQFSSDEVVPPTELLPMLRSGDIVTHCYQAHHGLFDANGSLLPVAADAIARGVLLDVGYSNADFSINIAKTALEKGIVPNTLSTDLNRFSASTVDTLAAVMTRFVNLGLPFRQVIEMVTSRAATALHKSGELGTLEPGRLADFTVSRWVDQDTSLTDGQGGQLQVSQMLQVQGACIAGEFIRIERSPFEPEANTPASPAFV